MPLLATAMNTVQLLPEEYQFTQKQGNNTYAHTFMIPMRDGVELETVVFTTDPGVLRSYSDSSVKPHKVVFERSPYNLMQTFTESVDFVAQYGYFSVIQSFRGRYGQVEPMNFSTLRQSTRTTLDSGSSSSLGVKGDM